MTLGTLFRLTTTGAQVGDTQQLLFSSARIGREDFKALCLADHVVQEAQRATQQVHEQALIAINDREQKAYEKGLHEGRLEGMAQVLGTLEVERQLRELLSHRLADIVEHCLHRFLGEPGKSPLMRQRILNLLKTCGAGSVSDIDSHEPNSKMEGLTLYVCPEQLSEVQTIINQLGDGHVGGVNVVADERRAPDALLLETKMGFVDSNLEITLQEVRFLVQQAVAHAMRTLGAEA
jgi:flagellar biosynthesis/type III secretory pathway protein FliH